MRIVKSFFLYFMAFLYVAAGTMHFINPDFYFKKVMPTWIPEGLFMVYFSGVIEILLGVALIPKQTRALSAWIIIAMLLVFLFVIHIPMSIHFYMTQHELLVASLIRLPFQFLLLWWAWLYTKKDFNLVHPKMV